MAVSNGYPYPGFTNPYVRGKLPSVKTQRNRKMCAGRIFIFLILGVILFVLGLVSMGVYLNVNGSTSSSQYTEIMPLYITSGAVILAGMCVCVLFWRRLKALVFVSVIICVATGFLCGITAVLTCTHVLQPLQTFRTCRYYMSQKLCQCLSPYKRDMLTLEYSEKEYTKYDFEDVLSCEEIEEKLPRLLYVLVGVYGLVFLLCIGSAILALLVLRAEKIKQRFLGDESYEEVYTVSGSSSQDQSDSEPDITTEVATLPRGQTTGAKNSILVTKSNIPSQGVSRDSSSLSVTQSVSSTTGNQVGPVAPRSLSPQQAIVGQNVQSQRSRTPGLNDFAKESLANRYKINKTPEREINYRQRLSKTPDREIGASRRYSFSASKRLSKSCDSLDSSGNVSREGVVNFESGSIPGKKKGKLKEHRRKGKRAATVHTLDTDQLLLILNLQMRYLQETREQQTNTPNTNTQVGSRRAITPQPVSQRQLIPQKVRSHTPQPRRANQRTRDQGEYNTYPQNYGWNLNTQGVVNNTNSESSSRRTSESSEKTLESVTGPSSSNFVYTKGKNVGGESYLLAQQMHKTEGYNPYIHRQFQNSSGENVHFVTYSDSMLNSLPNKPKTRASVQSHFLPPQPIRRGTHNQLPPQPVSRQKASERQLPSQPVQRGSSAFHIVDRNSKSRSPSASNDRIVEKIDTTPKRKMRKDYADAAIRENFSLNAKPFTLKESGDIENGFGIKSLNQVTQKHDNPNFSMKTERYFAGENIPPYSGPPSYKDHVSSCNTSVTSSLSSNPDDVYSLPKRRVVMEQDVIGKQTTDVGSSSNTGHFSSGAEIYENSDIILNDNFQRQVRSQQRELIYSSPAKSKVKQCIVPEDYYTQISKVSRDINYMSQMNEDECSQVRDIHSQRNFSENVYGNSGNRNEIDGSVPRNVYGNERDNTVLTDVYGNPRNVNERDNYAERNVSECVYGNSNGSQSNGFQYSYNPSFHGQIAPDAKYNEYEDVYDTPDNLPQEVRSNVGYTSYSVNTQGINGAKMTPVSKNKSKSPKKNNKSPYPVSNVHANSQLTSFSNSENINNNKQISDSVENVHAENVSKIPRIKLNDNDVQSAEILDDDVFLNEDSKTKTSAHKQKSTPGYSTIAESEKNQRNFASQNQNYQEISDFDLTNENPVSGHMVSDFTNDESETGYMKMSLPGKNMAAPNISQFVDQATHASSNQDEFSGHVTEITNQNLTRQLPDGTDNSSSEENEDYEETGV